MISELMPGLDSLSLPGLGTFTAEQMSASFSDKGYTINPPYRRLCFTSAETQDGLLAGLYASSNGVSPAEADAIIRAYTATLAEELRSRSSIEMPGLGRLRSTREGHLFFVPEEDLDISPEACGLVSVSLKSHSVAMPALPEIPERDELPAREETPAREVAPAPVKVSLRSVEQHHHHHRHHHHRSRQRKEASGLSKTLLWVAVPVLAVALLLGGFVALSRLKPDFTDRLLYTPEQLAIINTPENGPYISR
ncbi:MAG: hypothetical protein J5737_04475 [Bacteroidales bacterium]|nr:hypothetical protein [Bacteroidales bacterium]